MNAKEGRTRSVSHYRMEALGRRGRGGWVSVVGFVKHWQSFGLLSSRRQETAPPYEINTGSPPCT
jgi:hypothetical protein